MLIALLGYWTVGLPLSASLAFSIGLGGIGIWIGLATGLATVAALMISRWLHREALGLVPKAL
jgi:MATE family multidrug resistance protein